MNKYVKRLVDIVNIRENVDYQTADSSIRNNISFRGPNVIILACAIVIASVGLNVPSGYPDAMPFSDAQIMASVYHLPVLISENLMPPVTSGAPAIR